MNGLLRVVSAWRPWSVRLVEAGGVGARSESGAPWSRAHQSNAYCVWDAVVPEIITARPYVWFKPTTGSSRPVAPGEDPPGAPLNGQVPDPGRATVEQAVRENLCSAGYRRVANFIANQLGHAVCEGQVQIPTCRGNAVATCTAALQARGITDYLVTDAPVEQADPTIAPEDALGTEPPADAWIDSGEQVVVRRNPQPPIIDYANPRDPDCEVAQRTDTGEIDPFELVPPQYVFHGRDETGQSITIPLRYGDPYGNWVKVGTGEIPPSVNAMRLARRHPR